MSRTEMYYVADNGAVLDLCEFENSHRGAMLYWRAVAVRTSILTHETQYSINEEVLDLVWKMWRNPVLPVDWRIVLVSTFDNVLIKSDDFERVAQAFRVFAREVTSPPGCSVQDPPGDAGHAVEQARILQVLAQTAGDWVRGVCWNQTSVNDNPWWTYPDDAHVDEKGRPFNVNTDKPCWWLDLKDCGVE